MSYEKHTGWHKPCRRNFKMACCDCGLVHSVSFRIVKSRNGKLSQVQIKVERDNRATAGIRQKMIRDGKLKLRERPWPSN